MAYHIYEVYKNTDGFWRVLHRFTDHVFGAIVSAKLFTKKEAVAFARKLAKGHPTGSAQVVVH
jgi:hypothetical protein